MGLYMIFLFFKPVKTISVFKTTLKNIFDDLD